MTANLRYVATICLAFLPFFFPQTANAQASTGCGPSQTAHQILGHGSELLHGIELAPSNAIRPANLKWELPLATATGLLIAEGDQPLANRIHSASFQTRAGRWSNVGLIAEIGAAGATWAAGCAQHSSSLRDNGMTALSAMGAAAALDYGLKVAFNREYPSNPNGPAEFWEDGGSFPSGHAAASFAFASVIAHRYPHKRWVKWGAYGLATGVALSRYLAKRHFASDIIVGSVLGYVTGAYIADH
jgi:hypothetical protein